MNGIIRKLLFAIAFASSCLPSRAIELKKAEEYSRMAMAARQAGQFRAYLVHLESALRCFPDHPRILYRLACACALNGEVKRGLDCLERLAGSGLYFPLAAEADLAPLRTAAAWPEIERRYAANNKPLLRANPAFFLHEKDLVTEGVARDAASGAFFVGSVHRGKIVRVVPGGQAADFSRPEDGLWAVLGMKVDTGRRRLWVCSAAIPHFAGYKPGDEGRSGIFRYDLDSGALQKSYLLPGKPENHLLGDLALDSAGNVFATDSATPAIFTINAARDRLEPWLQKEEFRSLQGLDFTADGRTLFVADYAAGVYVVDIAAKKAVLLEPPRLQVLLGIDGLYMHRGALVAVQNGVSPQRVIRVSLDKKGARAEKLEVLEANHPLFDEPTLGVVVGDEFYFVANSQWGRLDDGGKLAADKLQEPVIMKLDLPREKE